MVLFAGDNSCFFRGGSMEKSRAIPRFSSSIVTTPEFWNWHETQGQSLYRMNPIQPPSKFYLLKVSRWYIKKKQKHFFLTFSWYIFWGDPISGGCWILSTFYVVSTYSPPFWLDFFAEKYDHPRGSLTVPDLKNEWPGPKRKGNSLPTHPFFRCYVKLL